MKQSTVFMRLLSETRAQLLSRPNAGPKLRKEWARDYLEYGRKLDELRSTND